MNFPFETKDGTHYDIITEQFLYKGTEQTYWIAKVYHDGAMLYKTANHEGDDAEVLAHTEGLKWAHKLK